MNNVAYSSLDEAFAGPLNPPPPGKKQRKHKKDGDREVTAYGPGPLEGSPDPDRLEEQSRPLPIPEPMHGPSGPAPAHNRKQSMGPAVEPTAANSNFFPLPGTTANSEEWEKAFMLEPTQNAMTFTQPARTVTQNLGASVGWQNNGWKRPVDGKNTLWRAIPEAAAPQADYASAPGLQQRLDDLTKKLDSLTGTSTPMNGTAELFLFVAIGLLLLLAIDTLLRFASSLASKKQTGGARMRMRSGLSRRLR